MLSPYSFYRIIADFSMLCTLEIALIFVFGAAVLLTHISLILSSAKSFDCKQSEMLSVDTLISPYNSYLSHRELIWSANFAMSLLVMTPSLLVTSASRRLAEASSLSKTPVAGFVFFLTATGSAS